MFPRSGLCLALLLLGMVAGDARAQQLPSDDLFQQPRRSAHRFDDFVYTLKERQTEATEKLQRVRKLLTDRKADGVVIATELNLNWLTAGGKDNVVWVQRETPVKLLITPTEQFLIADNIEGPRMMTEELAGLGYDWRKYYWHGKEADALGPLVKGKRILFDHAGTALTYAEKPAEALMSLQDLYYPITDGELKKYRWLGKKTAEVLEQVSEVVRPGMTEFDVQYLLARELWYWDILPTVLLTAADERFKTYRHPVVVGAAVQNYIALNVCARRWGLTVSTTRMVHFGEPDGKLADAWKRGPEVMAAMWSASEIGKPLGDAVDAAQKSYRKIGFPDEWRLHHQGGPILGPERLFLVQPGDRTKIVPGMVLAWNPTVQGSKFEDTVLVRKDGTLENLTLTRTWPSVEVTVAGKTFRVPVLKVRSKP